MITMDLNTSFEWRMAKDTPKDNEEPILCLTDNGKLMTFKNTKTLICPNTVESGFGHLVKKYKIKLWVYQKELLPDEIIINPTDLQKKLQGKNGKYKRYLGSPLRYAGGKSLAVGVITEFLPKDIKKIVSPFIGGGSVEIALAKELGIEVVAYDIFDLLVNYWQQQTINGKKLYEKLKTMPPTKEEYERVKNILKQHWDKEKGYDNLLDPIDAAVYYYYNMQLSYGPGFLGWMSSIYQSEKKYKSTIEKVRDFHVPNLKVYNKSFEESIPENQGEFLYLDPPYVLDECSDSKMFKGIYPMRNFPIHHNGFDHNKLCELLHEHKGGFILSYNDCSLVREAYKDFDIHEVHWQYTMGQGETRIGKNRSERDYDNGNVKTSHELLIIG